MVRSKRKLPFAFREWQGHLWVTRERPKIDRIAYPWLIRWFIDPEAEFLFVLRTASSLLRLAARLRRSGQSR